MLQYRNFSRRTYHSLRYSFIGRTLVPRIPLSIKVPLKRFLTRPVAPLPPETPLSIFQKIASKIENPVQADQRIRTLAVYAGGNPMFSIEGHQLLYLKELNVHADAVVYISANFLPDHELKKLTPFVIYAQASPHSRGNSFSKGFEWIQNQPFFEDLERIIFCSDEDYGPVGSFAPMFRKMEHSSVFQVSFAHQFTAVDQSVFRNPDFESMLTPKAKAGVGTGADRLTDTLKKSGFPVSAYVSDGADVPSPLVPRALVRKKVKDQNQFMKQMGRIARYNPELLHSIHSLLIPSFYGTHEKKSQDDINPEIWFSIILPTYNRKYCIATAIDSVCCQSFKNFELLILDDGSDDGTQAYIRDRYADQISQGRIRYYLLPRSGVSKARNFGFSQARNQWIAYIDSDNMLFPTFLETFARQITWNPERKAFYSTGLNSTDKSVIGDEFDYGRLKQANYIDMGAVVHQKSLIENGQGFDENLPCLEDWDLFLRIFQENPPFFIDCPLFLYRDQGKDRVTETQSLVKGNAYILQKQPDCHTPVTTIVVSYNHGKYIKQAIEGVLNQKGMTRHTVILSDDGSTDETFEIMKTYEADPRARVINLSARENKGASANYLRCLSAVETEYVAICEGDDYWTNDRKLYSQVSFLEGNPDCSMVFSAVKLYDQGTQTFRTLERQKSLPSKLTGQDFLNAVPSMGLIVNLSCCMFKNSLLKKMPTALHQPMLSEISLAYFCENYGKIGFIHVVSSVYRQHGASVWSGAKRKFQLEFGLNVTLAAYRVCQNRYRPGILNVINEFMAELARIED